MFLLLSVIESARIIRSCSLAKGGKAYASRLKVLEIRYRPLLFRSTRSQCIEHGAIVFRFDAAVDRVA